MRFRGFYFAALLLMVCTSIISCTDLMDILYPGDIVGISEDTPLGTLDEYESFLTERGIKKNGTVKEENILGIGDTHVFTREIVETQMGETGTFQSKLVINVDSEGAVLAVNAHILNLKKDKLRIFMKELWVRLSGTPPDFAELVKSRDDSYEPRLGNQFADKGVEGKWERLTFQEDLVRIALSNYASQALK